MYIRFEHAKYRSPQVSQMQISVLKISNDNNFLFCFYLSVTFYLPTISIIDQFLIHFERVVEGINSVLLAIKQNLTEEKRRSRKKLVELGEIDK